MSMSHRQWVSLRELRTMQEAEKAEQLEAERKRKDEEERPLREAEETYKQAHQQLAKTIRERILTQRDDELYVDPETKQLEMSWPDANIFNADHARQFVEANPGYFRCDANTQILGDYLSRNGVHIVSKKTLQAAYERLKTYGLITGPPPEPISEPQPRTQPARVAKVDPEQEKRKAWDKYTLDIVATDPGTGATYTQYQLDRCSAETFRRLVFGERFVPKIGDVIHGMR